MRSKSRSSKSGSIKTPRVEPPPKKGIAQRLLYDLQQMSLSLLNEPNTLHKPLSMEEGVRVKGGSSENYKRMGRFGSMVYYGLIADEPNYVKFRRQTLNYIRDERTRGHIGGEQGCSQPHDGMHLAATLLVHLYTVLRQPQDTEILEETRWWISSYLSICHSCYHGSYQRVAIPGFRCKDAPLSEVRDLIYKHCVLGTPITSLTSQEKLNKIQSQRFYLAVKLAIRLKLLSCMPEPTSTLPKLYAPMSIKRTSSSLFAAISIPKGTSGKSQTVEWLEIDKGHLTYCRADGVIVEEQESKSNLQETV